MAGNSEKPLLIHQATTSTLRQRVQLSDSQQNIPGRSCFFYSQTHVHWHMRYQMLKKWHIVIPSLLAPDLATTTFFYFLASSSCLFGLGYSWALFGPRRVYK